MRNCVVALACGLAVSGCDTTADQGPPVMPPNYRQMIAEYGRAQFYFDPYSIRDAAIAPPRSGVGLYGPIQTVCVRANAKNRMGGYIGVKASQFVFREGKVFSAFEDNYGAACGNDQFEPFPELEGRVASKS